MTGGQYGPQMRRQTARLSPEAQRAFDRLVRGMSRVNAAKRLGVALTTIEKLSGGLGVRADVIEKVEAALAERRSA